MADTGQLRIQPSATDNGIKNEIASPSITPAEVFHRKQYRWNTSEEIYAILTATARHVAWLSSKTELLPTNGSMILYDRDTEGLNYRRDGYIWKKRKDGKHIREDHMRLRVRGTEVVNGYYTHSAILSSFHRRSYNLPGRPNIMLVHYLNAPVEGNPSPVPTLKHCDKRVWGREELAQQIYPMYDMPEELTNSRNNLTHYMPPSRHLVDRMIDSLLASQSNEGVQVTAQWVLSLGSNGSYLVQAQPQTPSFQIASSNVQLVLAPLSTDSVIQPTQRSQQPVGVANVASPVPIAPSHDRQPWSSSHKLMSKSAAMQPCNHTNSGQSYLPTTSAGMQLQTYQATSTLNFEPQAITRECIQPALVRSVAGNDTISNNGNMGSSPAYQHVQGLTTPTLHGHNGHCVRGIPTSLSQGHSLQGKTIPAPLSHDVQKRATGVEHSLHEMTTPIESDMLTRSHPIAVHEQTTTVETPLSTEQCGETCSSLERDLVELSQFPMDVTPPHATPAESKDMSNVNTHLVEDMNTELNDMCTMTADEISSTLSANMPMSYSPVAAADLTNDLQLDSNFDLFAELNVNEELSQSVFNSADASDLVMPQEKVKLTALAPEWSYVDGGCKVLLVGPWKASISPDYTCLFGTKSVRAELVQDGVLACITPAHEHGEVEVKVSHLGHEISESCSFEFRDRKSELSRHRSWFLCEESRLQMALVDRLDMIKCRLDILFPAPALTDQMNLEQRVVALLHAIKRYKWRARDPLPKTSFKGLTLFHLAAALGYRALLEALNSWREESPCELLCEEVSTRARDANGCIALHWACALGRMETALVMYYMDRLSLDEVSSDGMTPLSLARAFKNKHVVEMLVQQEQTVLESKLDSQGLHKLPSAGSKHLRRSASPARHTSPVRHPPVTRHNSTPNSIYLPPPSPHPSHQPGAYESVPSCLTPEPLHAVVGDQSEDDEDSIVDIEGLSDNECSNVTDQDRDNQRIRTLAEHIIAAIPERIKSTAADDSSSVALLTYRERSSSRSSYSSTPSYAEDSGVCTPLTSDWVEEWNRSRLSSSPCFSAESIHRASHSPSFYPPYYHPPAVSPGLTANLHNTSAASTTSYNTGRSESPPPSAQILGEYFNAGEGVEYGLSQLTLSDTEQRKLYQAAQVIQHAFRQFKDKKQQQKEIEAAVIIQTYYRRFKEFTTLRHIQKQQAATRIQSQFRSYYAQKRFKKSRDAALLIQHHYRAYKEHEQFKRSRSAAVLIQQKFRTHYNRKKCSKQPSQDASGSRDGGSLRVMHHYPSSTTHK